MAASQLLWASPTSRRTRTPVCVGWTASRPTARRDLPRLALNLPCVPFPLPRRIGSGNSVPFPVRDGLPLFVEGSASATSLSGPARASLALRPARSLACSTQAIAPGLRHGQLPGRNARRATEAYRKLLGRDLHPLVQHNLVAHDEPNSTLVFPCFRSGRRPFVPVLRPPRAALHPPCAGFVPTLCPCASRRANHHGTALETLINSRM